MVVFNVIDYGVGNLFSMCNALRKIGIATEVIREPDDFRGSQAFVLPGVGNFGEASKNLSTMRAAILEAVGEGAFVLGSCLGMQLLFDWSEENTGSGLGLLRGGVRRFPEDQKTPHMGWNTIKVKRCSPILEGLPSGTHFYFVHSYYPCPVNTGDTVATTKYGREFVSIVERKNVYGCQFHPEKSGKAGAMLLNNYACLVRR